MDTCETGTIPKEDSIGNETYQLSGERNMCVNVYCIEAEGLNLFTVSDFWDADEKHRTRGEYMFLWSLRYAGVINVSLRHILMRSGDCTVMVQTQFL